MWESLFSHPRGRLSTRNYFSIATAFLVACFAYILAMAPTTHAADAKWNNDVIEYQQKNYRKESTVTVGNESHGIAAGAVIYKYVEAAGIGNGGSTQKAHLIYFPSGTDPATATSAKYQTFTLNSFGQYSQPSAVSNISLETSTTPGSTNPGTSSCVVEGIGWIICPVTNFLAGAMDTIYGWVSGFLKVAPLATSQDQALYRAWGYMRTLANVAFIIAFLVIIYSQITNVGLSNYDIKKMLPKIVIAAILVNTSYWICAIAVDLFNILGYSIQDLFIMIRNSLVGSEGNSWDVISWENMAGLVLSGGTVLGGASIAGYLGITTVTASLAGAATIGAGVSALIFLLLPLLISILFIVLITLLILAARQALITILIVIAPLAFVAFLLPNTEKWFEKWRSTLLTLLLVFPAFSLVFGGSQLASAAIIQNASGPDALTVILLGMAVQVAPLAITPLLLKLGGGVLNRFAGIVNNPSKGIFDRGKNWARERSAANKEAGLAALGERAKRMGYLNARPVSGQSGFRGRMATAGMRFNPMNMTYAREYNRREREGMKSANEAMTGALHTQTTAGRRIDFRNKDAHAEKHLGESNNQEAYNIAAYGANGNAHTYRAQLHHDAHTASGRAKVIEDRATANAERDLQTQVNTNAVLRNAKIQTDVDNAHAQLQSASVTADGKLQFQTEVSNDRNLRLMKVATFAAEQQASSIEGRLNKNAEARWNQLSRTDTNLQQLRLQEVQSTESAKRVEEQWNSMLANIRAVGGSAPGVANSNVSIANSIQGLAQDVSIESEVQESARAKQQAALAMELEANEALRTYAGGVSGASGAARVYAKAKSGIVSGYMENVKNNRSVISDYTLNELMRLSIEGQKRVKDASGNISWVKATEEEQMAAYQEVLLTKGNNWAAHKLKDKVAEKGMVYDENTGDYYDNETDMAAGINALASDEVESRRTEQQIFIDAFKQSKLDIMSTSGSDKSALESGLFKISSGDAIVRDLKQKKIKSSRWVKTDMDELQRMIQVLRDDSVRADLAANNPETLNAMIETIENSLTDERISENIDGRNQDLMKVIQGYAQNALITQGGTMSRAEKQTIEDLAETKVYTDYDPNVMYDRNSPTGPA